MGAFEQLLFERPFEKITVSAIAQRADVDRKTFYQHFGTIDGLLSALAERCVQQIVEAMDEELDVRVGEGGPEPDGAEAPYASGGSPRSDDGPREITAFFTAVNRVLSVNFEVNRRLVECMSTESIVERIREPLLDKLCDRHGSVMELDGRELGHAADFMLGGIGVGISHMGAERGPGADRVRLPSHGDTARRVASSFARGGRSQVRNRRGRLTARRGIAGRPSLQRPRPADGMGSVNVGPVHTPSRRGM